LPPTVGKAIAWALVPAEVAEQEQFEVEVRGKRLAAKRTATPFYRRTK